MQEQEFEVSIIVSNSRETPLTFILEPWGRAYEMEPHTSYTICFRSTVEPSPPNIAEVEYAEDRVTVYAWDGCLCAVYQNGNVLPPGAFVGPPLPSGVAILKNIGFLKATMDETLSRKNRKMIPD